MAGWRLGECAYLYGLLGGSADVVELLSIERRVGFFLLQALFHGFFFSLLPFGFGLGARFVLRRPGRVALDCQDFSLQLAGFDRQFRGVKRGLGFRDGLRELLKTQLRV